MMLSQGTAAYFTQFTPDYSVDPPALNDKTAISSFIGLDKSQGDRWIYDYGISNHAHVIEVLDILTSNDDSEGKIRFRGGEKCIDRNIWQMRSLDGVQGFTKSSRSNWKLDTTVVEARLSVVQKMYEDRKREDAN